MNTVKVGMIGAGGIAPMHCDGVKGHSSAKVIAVADINEPRAIELQQKFGIERVYTKVADLINDSDVDAVTIALPTYLHASVAIAALEAGKHVLLDKPFVMNQAEALKVIEAANKSGKVMTVAMNQRFSREAQTIRALIKRGDLGDIYFTKAYWCRRKGSPRFGTWFGDKEKSGGGALLDIGVHMLDLALSLLGNFKPEAVSGVSYTKFGNRGLGEGGWGRSDRGEMIFTVDDLSAAMIKLEGGQSLILEASWTRHMMSSSLRNVELFGTEGGAEVFPNRIYRFGEHPDEYVIVESPSVGIRYPHCDRMHNWIDAILGEDELECTLDQSLAVQKIIDGIYQSAETGREVSIK